MEQSFFTDKECQPGPDDVRIVLGEKFDLWQAVEEKVYKCYPEAVAEWKYPGKKYGWSYRLKDKKRVLIYFIPLEGQFDVAFVFGGKAMKAVMDSNVHASIKDDLAAAKQYVEGRGIRIPVKNRTVLKDVGKLIDIKVNS